MVRRDGLIATDGLEALGELMRQAFRHATGIHEDERRLVVDDLGRDRLDHLPHLLARRDGFEFGAGQDEFEVEGPAMARVDDRAAWRPGRVDAIGADPDEQASHQIDRFLGGGKPDARRPLVAERVEPLHRQRQMGAALVPRHGMDLVDDHRAHRPQDLAPPRRGKQEIERLGRRHEDLRRLLQHRRPRRSRRVSAAHPDADLGNRRAHPPRDRLDLRQGRL